jgi:hypothetical protein
MNRLSYAASPLAEMRGGRATGTFDERYGELRTFVLGA